MKLALFASGSVGLEIASVLAELHPAALVVVDGGDRDGLNAAIAGTHPGVPVIDGDDIVKDATVLAQHDVDLGLLAWWPKIITQDVIDAPRLGFLNCHPSLLPHGRGKDPNFWAIVERTPFGVTIHHVDASVDGGPIAFHREIPVTPADTGETLYAKAASAMVALVREALPRIAAGDIPSVPQTPMDVHRRADIDGASRIDLDAPTVARDVLDVLRARTFRPHPAAYFEVDGRRYEVTVDIKPLD